MRWLDSVSEALARDVVAIEATSHVDASSDQLSASLSHPATSPISAIVLVKAVSAYDAGRTRISFSEIHRIYAGRGREAELLHGLSQEMGRLRYPLLITFGGRRLLPALLTRSLLCNVPAHFLTLQQHGFGQLARRSMNWHIDLEDLLSGYGSMPSPDLRALGYDIDGPSSHLEARAINIFDLYLRLLRCIGILPESSFARASAEMRNAGATTPQLGG